MPRIPGRLRRRGFNSPAPPKNAPREIKTYMANTYAGLRSSKYPGENKGNKQHAARLTWYLTKRKFSGFFRAQKVSKREFRSERREHPEFTNTQIKNIVIDHHLRGDNTKPARENKSKIRAQQRIREMQTL